MTIGLVLDDLIADVIVDAWNASITGIRGSDFCGGWIDDVI